MKLPEEKVDEIESMLTTNESRFVFELITQAIMENIPVGSIPVPDIAAALEAVLAIAEYQIKVTKDSFNQ